MSARQLFADKSSIPMRGQEIGAAAAVAVIPEPSSIPMRGQESTQQPDRRRASTKSSIPMRGQETFGGQTVPWAAPVIHPHEGSGVWPRPFRTC